MYDKQQITNILKKSYNPFYLEVIDDSHKHKGDAVNTHFRVIIVSDFFKGTSKINRHRCVYKKLDVSNNIYSLSLFLFTIEEWDLSKGFCYISNCMNK